MSEKMLGVNEARDLILASTEVAPVCELPLHSILGMVLAAPVRAIVDVPAFDNSAMDGFALDHRVTVSAASESPVRLPIVGYQSAGTVQFQSLKPGEALRIATGAQVPMNVTAIIPLEDVIEDDDTIVISAPVRESAHIRRRGEETRRGDAVLMSGMPVTAPVAGYLASIGVASASVYTRPRVGILPTGTELMPVGTTLGPGQIYESNGVALAAALQHDGITPIVYPSVSDDPTLQQQAIAKMMGEVDVVLVTGGVSVGHLDFVKDIFGLLDVKPLFWKVRQKPGKPLFAGKRGHQMVFGLPGNPASTLTAYYEYVRPMLRKRMGHQEWILPEINIPCTSALKKESGKTHFLRARVSMHNGEWQVMPFMGQGSHTLRSFAEANGLVVLPEETTEVNVGDVVEVHVLPEAAIFTSVTPAQEMKI